MPEPRPQDRHPLAGRANKRDVDLESTSELLVRAREGDTSARGALAARYLPALRRFAHGRLPSRARSVFDTDDLVQVTITRALNQLEDFELRRQGSLLAYLRRIVLNRVKDEVRRVARQPEGEELPEDLPDPSPSPVEEVMGREALARYERALAGLPPDCQEAIMLRAEMGCSYAEIAEALGCPSANAARLHTARALLKLAGRLRPFLDES